MESINELKAKINQLTIERDTHIAKEEELRKKLDEYLGIVSEAEFLLDNIPKEYLDMEIAKTLYDNKDIIDLEYILTNTNMNKLLSLTNKFSIDENSNILFGNLNVGKCNDERFKNFLIKIIPTLPYLYKLYARYFHYSSLCSKMDEFEYLGKEVHRKIQSEIMNFNGKKYSS